jgi:hypothetical protein
MIMPIDLQVSYKSGTSENYNIPLSIMYGHKPFGKLSEPWAWTYPTYTLTLENPIDEISSVKIDPGRQMADINTTNNIYLLENSDDDTPVDNSSN